MHDFANPKYEDMIKWINNHKAHGDTWEQIKYACKGNVEELRKFLEIAQFKKIVALGYLIQQKYRNDIRNMLP